MCGTETLAMVREQLRRIPNTLYSIARPYPDGRTIVNHGQEALAALDGCILLTESEAARLCELVTCAGASTFGVCPMPDMDEALALLGANDART